MPARVAGLKPLIGASVKWAFMAGWKEEAARGVALADTTGSAHAGAALSGCFTKLSVTVPLLFNEYSLHSKKKKNTKQ